MKAKQYAQALHESLQDVKDEERNRRFENFIRLLEFRSHQQELPKILKYFKKLRDDGLKKQTVEVVTALEISKESQGVIKEDARFKKILEKSNCTVRYRVDPTLVGGVIVKSYDEHIDAGYKNRLLELYQKLVSSV